MALITDQPEDLASSNDLDNVEDPDQPEGTGERAEIYLSGAHVATLDNAPNGLGRVTLMTELEVIEESIRFNENGDEIAIRRCRRVGDMWRPGTARPPTKEEIQAEQQKAKIKAAAEKAAQEEAERAEKEQNEPPMFNEDGDPISDDAPRPPAEDADPDSEPDGGDDRDAKPDDSNVVAFSDKPKGKK